MVPIIVVFHERFLGLTVTATLFALSSSPIFFPNPWHSGWRLGGPVRSTSLHSFLTKLHPSCGGSTHSWRSCRISWRSTLCLGMKTWSLITSWFDRDSKKIEDFVGSKTVIQMHIHQVSPHVTSNGNTSLLKRQSLIDERRRCYYKARGNKWKNLRWEGCRCRFCISSVFFVHASTATSFSSRWTFVQSRIQDIRMPRGSLPILEANVTT